MTADSQGGQDELAVPKGRAASTVEKRESLWEKAALVVLGAVVAVVPVITSSYLQTRAQLWQLRVDRRVLALRDYSAACSRFVVATERLLELQEIMRQTRPARGTQEEAFVSRQLEVIRGELAAAGVERRTQRDVVNALFGTDLKTPTDLEIPESLREIAKGEADRILREGIPRLAEECRQVARLLASRLEQ